MTEPGKRRPRTRRLMCRMCEGEVDASGRCTRCGAYVGGRDWMVHVEGTDATEVQRVAEKLSERSRQASDGRRSPWAAGSFYLAAAIVLLVLLLTAAKLLNPLVLPVVIVGAVVLVSVVGGLQLRQDERLAEKNFLQLMSMALAQLRLLGKRASSRDQGIGPDESEQSAAEQGD